MPSAELSPSQPLGSVGPQGPQAQSIDRLAVVQGRLDEASCVMQENVTVLLSNLEQANKLEGQTLQLSKSANKCAPALCEARCTCHSGRTEPHLRRVQSPSVLFEPDFQRVISDPLALYIESRTKLHDFSSAKARGEYAANTG
ncbi:MAG: hypothetical protein SGPRY_007240 [Prymnesium sp.]